MRISILKIDEKRKEKHEKEIKAHTEHKMRPFEKSAIKRIIVLNFVFASNGSTEKANEKCAYVSEYEQSEDDDSQNNTKQQQYPNSVCEPQM